MLDENTILLKYLIHTYDPSGNKMGLGSEGEGRFFDGEIELVNIKGEMDSE